MLPPEAQPFDLPGDERGVLLVHGLTGTPFEVRGLGEHLAARGLTVVGPLLPGHGETPAVLDASRHEDWVAGVEAAFDALRGRCARVAVVGLSLGGLLSLDLARRRGPELVAVGSLAAPLWLPRLVTRAIPLWAHAADVVPRLAYLPKVGGSDVSDDEMRRRNPSLPAFAAHASASFIRFVAHVRAGLPEVRVPAFVAHGDHDHTAPPASLDEMAARLGSPELEVLVLPRSWHLVTLDVERDLLAERLTSFLERKLA